jgi:hypothetical protein
VGRRAGAILCALALALAAATAGCGWGSDDPTLAADGGRSASTRVGRSTTSAEPTTTTAAPTTTAVPTTSPPTTQPPTTAPPTTAPPTTVPAPPQRFTFDPYAGLGSWLDVYDWSATFTEGNPQAGPADVDRMADLGVQTLYLQVSKWDSPTDVLEPERLFPIIDRAHARGLRVVAWYLPMLEDPAGDLRRLLAAAALPVEGLAVDIEARKVVDEADRNARLVALSAELRAHLPGETIGAIVLPPVVMEEVNPAYWPSFPWAGLAPHYDVWLPMAYWTNRAASSGWRDGYAYTAANVDRVRERIGRPGAVVHPIGGIGDASSPNDVAGMLAAAAERGAIGGSLYDYRTTHDGLWPVLAGFRAS